MSRFIDRKSSTLSTGSHARCDVEIKCLRTQLAASQAEVERLREQLEKVLEEGRNDDERIS